MTAHFHLACPLFSTRFASSLVLGIITPRLKHPKTRERKTLASGDFRLFTNYTKEGATESFHMRNTTTCKTDARRPEPSLNRERGGWISLNSYYDN